MTIERPFSVSLHTADPLHRMSITLIQTCVTPMLTLEEDTPRVILIALARWLRGHRLTFSWSTVVDVHS